MMVSSYLGWRRKKLCTQYTRGLVLIFFEVHYEIYYSTYFFFGKF
jgi:hypothetical protein